MISRVMDLLAKERAQKEASRQARANFTVEEDLAFPHSNVRRMFGEALLCE